MTSAFTRTALLAVLVPLASAQAQDNSAGELLAQSLNKMRDLPGVSFKTVEAQDNSMMRQFRDRMPAGMGDEETEVSGEWCHGTTRALINFEDDEVIRHAGRTIARGNGDWKLRSDTTADGKPLPFILDPGLLFEVLSDMPTPDVQTSETGKYRGNDLMIIGVTIDGDMADDLSQTGAFPKPSAGGGMIVRMSGMGNAVPADVTVDLAFYIDPESALIHRLRVKVYKDNPHAGQIRVQVNGDDGSFDSDDDDGEASAEELDADGNRIYKRGLPVRDLGDNLSLADFDVSFADHSKTFALDLDERLRKTLRLSNSSGK